MAMEHALPRVFSLRERTRPVPWVALLVLTAAALGFTLAAPLGDHLDFRQRHLPADLLRHQRVGLAAAPAHRARRASGRSTGAVATGAGFVLLLWRTYLVAPQSLLWIAGIYAGAIALETALTLLRGRRFVRRVLRAR